VVKLSEREVEDKTTICKCGERVRFTRILINNRTLVEMLPEKLKDKAQGMREKGEKPAVMAGKCQGCGETYGALISTGQEKGHFDFIDLRREGSSHGVIKVC